MCGGDHCPPSGGQWSRLGNGSSLGADFAGAQQSHRRFRSMPSIFPPEELPHPDAGVARGTASGQGSSTGDQASAPESGLAELEQLLEIEAGTLLHGSGEDQDGGGARRRPAPHLPPSR